MTEHLYELMEDLFVWPHDLCLAAADLVFPMNELCSLRHDLFVLAEGRCKRTKARFALIADLRGLAEGLLSFAECGCKVSEVLS